MKQVSQFKSLYEVLDHFKSEKTCREYLAFRRWKGNVSCPHCDCEKVYVTNRGYRCGDKNCGKKFTVTTQTVMQDTKIKLRIWIAAMYLISAHKRGISSYQLARDLNITQRTAWHLNHRIRETLKQKSTEKISSDKIVELDETFVGGKNKNRHADKKVKNSQGRSFKDKTPVLGILERGGKIRTFVVRNTEENTIMPLVEQNVEYGAALMTDEWKAYSNAGDLYDHKFVRHGAKQYVDGIIHDNGCENFWSHLKRSINGTYYHVSPKHLQRYCDEIAFKFNSRKETDCERFDEILTHTKGTLTYKQLIHS